MLRQAKCKKSDLLSAQADCHHPLPLASSFFNDVPCASVGEHISKIECSGGQLRPSRRRVRLGAVPYTTDDYFRALQTAGFGNLQVAHHEGDFALEAEIGKPGALAGRRLLLSITAEPYIMK